jgi:hypothetical protein
VGFVQVPGWESVEFGGEFGVVGKKGCGELDWDEVFCLNEPGG